MYIDPWIVWLILAPLAALAAIYIGYVALLLVGLLSITIGIGLNIASESLCTGMSPCLNGLAASCARGLGFLVRPFRHYGPWLDYAVVAGIAVALSLGAVLWLAA